MDFQFTDGILVIGRDDASPPIHVGSVIIALAPHDPVPVGTIWECHDTALPHGCVICNGQAVSRKTFAELFAAIGTVYGEGDGATTFNLPNFPNHVIKV